MEKTNVNIKEKNQRQEEGWMDDVASKNDMTTCLAWYDKAMWLVYVTWDDMFSSCGKFNLI